MGPEVVWEVAVYDADQDDREENRVSKSLGS